jgi:hypothetical protein
MALTRPRAAQIYDIDYKQATRVVTVANITLASGAPNSVDGVNLSLNDRVLVTGQSTASQNGVYYVATVGSGSNGTWSRSLDTNNTGEILTGTIIMVTEGTIYADTQWKLITDGVIDVGVTDQVWTQNYSANSISSGNSNVVVNSNANVTISSAGVANVLNITATGPIVTGNLLPSANITYNLGSTDLRWKDLWLSNSTLYIGNVTVAATATTLTINGSNVLTGTASGDIQTAGNVSATGNVIGGNLLTGGYVSATGNVTGGNVTTGGLITATGNVTGGNITTAGQISATANVTGGNLVTGGVATITGNVIGGNITTTGQISATGNITGDYFLGNVFFANGITASKIYSGNSEVNVTSSGGNVNVSVGGTSNVAVFTTDGEYVTGLLSASGNLTAGNVLTSGLISATGNATAGNVLTAGQVSATGNITGDYFLGNVFFANGITASKIYSGNSEVNVVSSGGNVNISVGGTSNVAVFATSGEYVTGLISATGNITSGNLNTTGTIETGTLTTTGNATIGGNLTVNGNTIYINITELNVQDPIISLGRGTNNAPLTTNDGKDRGEQLWYYTSTEQSAFVGYQNLSGKLIAATNVSISNEIVTVNSYGTLIVGTVEGSTVSVTGNTTAGNINTTGLASVTGNVIGGNITTAGLISSTGNITGGNILTSGQVSATGNVTGNYIFGNASQVTGVNTFSTISVATQSNIVANSIATPLTFAAGDNIELTTDATNRVLTIAYTGSGGSSIFATGGDMGLVTEAVTAEEDLGLVTEIPPSLSYDLGQLGVDGVVSNSDIIANTITGDKINSSTSISITGNLTAANMALTSSASDSRGWWYSGNTVSVASQDTSPTGVALGSSLGTAIYVAGATTDAIYQYNMTTGFDLSTASYASKSISVVAQDASPQDILVDSTGSTLYMLGGANATVYQYTLSVNSIDTASYASKSKSVSAQEPTPTALFINSAGTNMYVVGTTNKTIYGYTITDAGNVANAAYAISSLSVSAEDSTPVGLSLNATGTIAWIVGAEKKHVYQYNLSEAYNIGTGVYASKMYVGDQENAPSGLSVSTAAGYAYIPGSSPASVFQYGINNATIATANALYLSVSTAYLGGNLYSQGNVTTGNLLTVGIVSATGNIITSTSGRIGVGTTAPDCELNILAAPQTVNYTVAGNSTTAGTDLHISGADGANTRITQDAFGTGSYVAFTGRSSRGTAATPTQTQSGDTIAQFTGRGFSNGSLQFGNASTGRLDVVAAENFTDTSRATNVQIYTTAASSITPTAIATFSSANGLSVGGNVTGGNILTGGLISATANITGGNILITSALSVGGNITSRAVLETATITATAPAAPTNFDIVTQAVQYYTANANANVTLNFRGSATTTANALLTTGQSTTIALLWTNGATAYYPNVIQVDGANVTPKWQGGTAVSGGNPNAIDVYAFTIIKTAATPTYVVLGSQTKFS